ncbi:MAG TPA: hypothetical protein VG096_08935 [Bryobacteraceae bacterium]|nr:hypothetical protein [Bryobacteraceae bacterium]
MSNLRCCGIGVGFLHILWAKVHTNDMAAKLRSEEVGALALTAGHVEKANTAAEAQLFSRAGL